MEELLRRSGRRFKATFLRFFLAYILGILVLIGATGTIILGGLFLYAIYLFTGQSLVTGVVLSILGLIMGVSGLIGLTYLGTWVELAQIVTLTDNSINQASAAYRKSRPLTWQYLGYSIISSLFMIGLLPGFALILPMLAWVVWSMFDSFAFLDDKRGGLMPLWYSKAKAEKSFWKIVLYGIVLYLPVNLLTFTLNRYYPDFAWVSRIIWFLFTPFALAFTYELYLSLPEPKEVKGSTKWLTFSIIGWLLNIIIALLLVIGLIGSSKDSKLNQEWIKEINQEVIKLQKKTQR